jgi:soluble lytic murein transglycosylase-like protein
MRKLLFITVTILFLSTCTSGRSDDSGYCFDAAGERFGIQPELLEAISYVESRHTSDALNENKNGSLDYGHMQINSVWVSKIGKAYIALDDPCFCTEVGAWILSGCIERYGYNSNAISCYNSGKPLAKLSGKTKTAVKNYIRRVEERYHRLISQKD